MGVVLYVAPPPIPSCSSFLPPDPHEKTCQQWLQSVPQGKSLPIIIGGGPFCSAEFHDMDTHIGRLSSLGDQECIRARGKSPFDTSRLEVPLCLYASCLQDSTPRCLHSLGALGSATSLMRIYVYLYIVHYRGSAPTACILIVVVY